MLSPHKDYTSLQFASKLVVIGCIQNEMFVILQVSINLIRVWAQIV